jgi:TPR repeat protein
MEHIGLVYDTKKKQYDKALAWYILAAMENNPQAQNNIGVLYYYGNGVPKNYLCALKWFLKSVEENDHVNTLDTIGLLFENGFGVPLNKYKALEWFCQGGDKTHRERLNGQGYHQNKSKSTFTITLLC